MIYALNVRWYERTARSFAKKGDFGKKKGEHVVGKPLLTHKVADGGRQIWYQSKAYIVRKAIMIFLAQQSAAMLTIFAHEKKHRFSLIICLILLNINSDITNSLALKCMIT